MNLNMEMLKSEQTSGQKWQLSHKETKKSLQSCCPIFEDSESDFKLRKSVV